MKHKKRLTDFQDPKQPKRFFLMCEMCKEAEATHAISGFIPRLEVLSCGHCLTIYKFKKVVIRKMGLGRSNHFKDKG